MSLIPPVTTLPESVVPARLPTMVVGAPTVTQDAKEAQMRAAAEDFEAVFLTEMLSYTGLGETRETFGGGVGEEAFSGMLASEQAQLLVERGGIGLAEHIFEALKARESGGA